MTTTTTDVDQYLSTCSSLSNMTPCASLPSPPSPSDFQFETEQQTESSLLASLESAFFAPPTPPTIISPSPPMHEEFKLPAYLEAYNPPPPPPPVVQPPTPPRNANRILPRFTPHIPKNSTISRPTPILPQTTTTTTTTATTPPIVEMELTTTSSTTTTTTATPTETTIQDQAMELTNCTIPNNPPPTTSGVSSSSFNFPPPPEDRSQRRTVHGRRILPPAEIRQVSRTSRRTIGFHASKGHSKKG